MEDTAATILDCWSDPDLGAMRLVRMNNALTSPTFYQVDSPPGADASEEARAIFRKSVGRAARRRHAELSAILDEAIERLERARE